VVQTEHLKPVLNTISSQISQFYELQKRKKEIANVIISERVKHTHNVQCNQLLTEMCKQKQNNNKNIIYSVLGKHCNDYYLYNTFEQCN